MKRVLSFTAVAAALAVLSGCANPTIGDMHRYPVYAQDSVKGKAEDLYYRLVMQAPVGSICGQTLQTANFPSKGEFGIVYGAGGMGVFEVQGIQTGDTVRVNYRQVDTPIRNVYSQRVPKFIRTGSCD